MNGLTRRLRRLTYRGPLMADGRLPGDFTAEERRVMAESAAAWHARDDKEERYHYGATSLAAPLRMPRHARTGH